MQVILLITAAILIFSPVYGFAANNLDQDNLVSCRSSKDQPPNDSTSDSYARRRHRSGA